MGYSQVFVADHIEDPGDLHDVLLQVQKMGFDPVREEPVVLALYQVTEGLERYDELKQNLQLQVPFNHETATLSFLFRCIREEDEEVFQLLDIQTTLRVNSEGDAYQIFQKSFGKSPAFPAKDQMIRETVEHATRLIRAQAVKKGMDAVSSKDVTKAIQRRL